MATKLIDRQGRKHVASSAMPDHIHVLIECEGIQDIDIVEFIAFVDRKLGEHRREIAVIMIPPPFQMYATVFVTLNKLLHEEGMSFERELNLMFPGIGDVFMPDEFDIDTGFSPDQTIN